MKRTNLILIIIFTIILATAAFGVRLIINMNPLPEDVSRDALVAMIYDLVYFCSLVQIIFLILTLVMLLYLILRAEGSEATGPKKKQKKVEYKQEKKQEKKKPKDEEKSDFMKQWRRLHREADKAK